MTWRRTRSTLYHVCRWEDKRKQAENFRLDVMKSFLTSWARSQATSCAASILGGFWDQTATHSMIVSCLLGRRLDSRPSDLLSNLNYPLLIVYQYCVKLLGLNCIFLQRCNNRCDCTFWCLKESAFNSALSVSNLHLAV